MYVKLRQLLCQKVYCVVDCDEEKIYILLVFLEVNLFFIVIVEFLLKLKIYLFLNDRMDGVWNFYILGDEIFCENELDVIF